jgi:flotillin
MEAFSTIVILLLVPGLALICAAAVLRFARVAAQPDEWLLRMRNGRVLDAGIGIVLWRRPGDVIARFSSAVQRVRFTAQAPTAEHLPVAIDGFILWSVAPDAGGAFRAFSKLGIANLDHPPPGLKSRAHLLTSSQHHAFQALLAAEVRAQAGALSLAELLSTERLLGGLERRLQVLAEQLGIVIERVEVLQVQPADSARRQELSARSEERLREEAGEARLEAAGRLRKRQAEQALREAAEQLELRLARADADRRIALGEQEAESERERVAEARALELFVARQKREEAELAGALDRIRRTAAAERDSALLRQQAEEQKSPAVREHELAKFVVEKTAGAMASWQIREGKWVHLGNASPAASIGSALLGVREIVAGALREPESKRGAA